MDAASRSAVAVLEALGVVYRRFVHLGQEMARRPDVVRAETKYWPIPQVNFSLILDLASGHSIAWTVMVSWDIDRWTIGATQDWTRPFPHDGWHVAHESWWQASDLSTLLARLAAAADELVALARTTDIGNESSWQK